MYLCREKKYFLLSIAKHLLLLRCDLGNVRDRFGGTGGFKGWLRCRQCSGVNLITIRGHSSKCLYYIVLINEQIFS